MKRIRLTNEEKEIIMTQILGALNTSPNISEITVNINDLLPPEKNKNDSVKPVLQITSEVYTAMTTLVKQYNDEISWHCFCHRDLKNQIYKIYDIILFPQINSATATMTDEEAYSSWITKLITDPESDFENMRVHGHSHVNMQVFSSGVDDAYQKDLLSKINDDDYYIFLILNKKQEMCVLIYDYYYRCLYETKDIIIQILDNDGNNIEDWASNQIKEYCSKEKTTRRYNYPSSYSSLYLDNQEVTPILKERKRRSSWT